MKTNGLKLKTNEHRCTTLKRKNFFLFRNFAAEFLSLSLSFYLIIFWLRHIQFTEWNRPRWLCGSIGNFISRSIRSRAISVLFIYYWSIACHQKCVGGGDFRVNFCSHSLGHNLTYQPNVYYYHNTQSKDYRPLVQMFTIIRDIEFHTENNFPLFFFNTSLVKRVFFLN